MAGCHHAVGQSDCVWRQSLVVLREGQEYGVLGGSVVPCLPTGFSHSEACLIQGLLFAFVNGSHQGDASARGCALSLVPGGAWRLEKDLLTLGL